MGSNDKIGEILNGKHIEKAEEVFKGNKNLITSTKLRKLFILTSEMNKKSKPGDKEEIENNLNYLKMKMCYEIGRDEQVEKFNDKALLIEILSKIIEESNETEKKNNIKIFYEYMEALVAYEKFYNRKK